MTVETLPTGSVAAPTTRPAAGRRPASRRLRPADTLLPVAVALWAWGISQADVSTLGGLGLVTRLPLVCYVGIGLLVVSVARWLAAPRPSRVRLALHVGALAVMLYGATALLYTEPRYAWLYKHVGVTQYIAHFGHVGSSTNIYNDWPGYFALVAWFDHLAGISSPLTVAAWAPLLFNLLSCLMLAFASSALGLTWRQRWIAIFLFEGANWVAQDYLSPQAAAFVLGLGIVAITLHWFQRDTIAAWLQHAISRAREKSPPSLACRRGPSPGGHATIQRLTAPTPLLLGAVVVSFAALVIMHELSPYVIAIELGMLTVVGKIRPRWLAPMLLVIAVAYTAPHFAYVNRSFGLLDSLGNFFSNARPPSAHGLHLSHDQLVAANAARLLTIGMWALALLGAWRRRRAGKPVLVLMTLAFSPFLLLGLQGYGGEALLRVDLFSLPWSACLAASALSPLPIRGPDLGWVTTPVALLVAIALFFPAYFGADSLNRMSRSEVGAATYLDSKAKPGTVLYLDQNFPGNIGYRSDSFQSQMVLSPTTGPGSFDLSPSSAVSVTDLAREFVTGNDHVYLVMTDGMLRFARAYGLTPSTSLIPLEQALLQSGNWRELYSQGGAVIYELNDQRQYAQPGAHGYSYTQNYAPGTVVTPTGQRYATIPTLAEAQQLVQQGKPVFYEPAPWTFVPVTSLGQLTTIESGKPTTMWTSLPS